MARVKQLGSGDRVEIEWGGSWWPGKIIRKLRGERYRISYDGYGAVWHEVVGKERVRAVKPTPVRQRAFAVGDRVEIEWRKEWWPGAIIGVRPRRRYRIAYDGYGEDWHETVGTDRLRRRLPAGRRRRTAT